MLRPKTIAELIAAAKVVIRGGIAGVGTEAGTDHDLTLNAAARLLYGVQVAAAYVLEQLVPRSADAQNRDRMADMHGLVFDKPATAARGFVALRRPGDVGTVVTSAGYVFTVPASAFADNVARTFRTLEDMQQGPYAFEDEPGLEIDFRRGSSLWKVRPKHIQGSAFLRPRSLVRVKADGGASAWLTAVRRVNVEDHSADFIAPIKGRISEPVVTAEKIALVNDDVVVMAECITPGAIGNCPWAIAEVDIEGATGGRAVIFEMAGGGDAVGAIDADTERVVRLLEDTIACPPGFANLQHWREIALSCPDVDLDDAVVYQHARGPGTIDIVCIGRSGGIRSSTFPAAHIGFTFWGNNTRRIGEIAAAKVEAWCKARAPYFADIKVRSVEWDWRGHTGATVGSAAFLHGSTVVELRVEPHDGYGPDARYVADVSPHALHSSRLLPASPSGAVSPQLRVGHRVWVTVGHATAPHHPFATVVTEVLAVAADRSYATIANVQGLAPVAVGHYDLESPHDLVIHRWGTAGPLTQPVLDAVYGYFDRLGPGSYLFAPKGPGYVRRFALFVYPPVLSPHHAGIERWPPEGRRWNSGFRASELRAAILAVRGVKDVTIGGDVEQLVDFDPKAFETLALTGCIPRYP